MHSASSLPSQATLSTLGRPPTKLGDHSRATCDRRRQPSPNRGNQVVSAINVSDTDNTLGRQTGTRLGLPRDPSPTASSPRQTPT